MHLLGCFWFFTHLNGGYASSSAAATQQQHSSSSSTQQHCHPTTHHSLPLSLRYETTWLTSYDDGSGVTAETSVQYLYSVYWALTTLTTVGYGDITPANNAERKYTLMTLLIGALVFGYILSSVGEMMGSIDKNAAELDNKLGEVKDLRGGIRCIRISPRASESTLRSSTHASRPWTRRRSSRIWRRAYGERS